MNPTHPNMTNVIDDEKAAITAFTFQKQSDPSPFRVQTPPVPQQRPAPPDFRGFAYGPAPPSTITSGIAAAPASALTSLPASTTVSAPVPIPSTVNSVNHPIEPRRLLPSIQSTPKRARPIELPFQRKIHLLDAVTPILEEHKQLHLALERKNQALVSLNDPR